MRSAIIQLRHVLVYGSLFLGAGVLTFRLNGSDVLHTGVAWHREVLIHTCAPAAVLYVLATLVRRNWFWALTAGVGAGAAVFMLLEGIKPKGWIFWPFISDAMQGIALETIVWLYANCLLLILITGAAAVKIRWQRA